MGKIDESSTRRLAILVGGGPAPGINSVIGAATIRCCLEDVEVVGIRDGFESIMRGNIDHVTPLTIDAVSRIHFRGGSVIGTSRANPTTDPKLLENVVTSLLRLNVSQLITIGGDDTAYSAMQLERVGAGAACEWCTCRRPSTTISTCRPTSRRSASRPRGITASRSSRT